ncbi:opsin, blue-sensitive-like [Neocloeon triangulifer]|uniref:opsin, blue-sensitive-like n=1 Tax=Neocloeon triangulifer TaxID=2078957 RepID=UPI00286EE181|nr:opsin, blue-sensitive-like [Neocloeon triangulifer]
MLLNPSLPSHNLTLGEPFAEARAAAGGEKLAGVDLPPELVGLVDPHWLSFPPASDADHMILGVIYFFIFFAGVIGNSVVLITFLTTRALRTSSNLFLANLAVLDLVMMSQLPIFVANSLYQGQVLGTVGCNLFGTLGAISGMGNAVNNVAIAYDRYRSISSPMDGRMSMKTAAIFIAFVWFYAMPFSLMPAFEIWNRYIPEGYLTTCSFDYLTASRDTSVFTICIFVYAYVVPVLCLVFFYSRILAHVRAHEEAMRLQAKKMGVKSLTAGDEEKSAEIKIAKVAVGIFFLFLCAWTPYATVALLGCFGSNRAVLTPFASMVPAVFSKTVACLDPWVYAISHPKFREHIHNKFPWLISAGPTAAKKTSDSSSMASAETANISDKADA